MDDRSCDPALAASAPPATAAAAAQVNALPQYFPVTAVAASAPRCSSGMPLTGAGDVAAQASAAHLIRGCTAKDSSAVSRSKCIWRLRADEEASQVVEISRGVVAQDKSEVVER